MPPAATGSRASRGNRGSGKQISLAEIRTANPVRLVSPVSRDKATARQPEATVRQAHRMAARTEGQLAARAEVPGPAATVQSIASGTAAIPEGICPTDAERSPGRLDRRQ